jgi:hypothetical protein
MQRWRIGLAVIVLGCVATCAVSIAQKKDDWAINNAMIGPDSPIEMRAGSTYQAQAVYPVPDGPLYPLKAKVSWKIEPAVTGISIDPNSGKIIVQADVAHGTTATIAANVDNGRRKLTAKLYVFRPEMNPLIGSWSIESQSACGETEGLKALAPNRGVVGLGWKFHVDEQFWIGRERGIAAGILLSGRYQFNVKTREMTLIPEWPKGKKSSSWTWSFEENGAKLLLRTETGGCTYVLRRD